MTSAVAAAATPPARFDERDGFRELVGRAGEDTDRGAGTGQRLRDHAADAAAAAGHDRDGRPQLGGRDAVEAEQVAVGEQRGAWGVSMTVPPVRTVGPDLGSTHRRAPKPAADVLSTEVLKDLAAAGMSIGCSATAGADGVE